VSGLELALWGVALAVAVWILGPVVAFFAGRRRLDVDVYAEPPLARPYPEDADGGRAYDAFVELGFEPMGWTSEHARFLTPIHWRWRSVQGSRQLASSDRKTYVALYRVVADEPVRLSATTLFEGGGSFSTNAPGAGIDATPVENHGRAEVRGVGPRELLERHAELAAAFARERGLVAKAATLAEVAQATVAFSRAQLDRMKSGGLAGMPLGLFGFALPMAIFLRAKAHNERGALLAVGSVLFMGLFYAAMRYGLLSLTTGVAARHMHTKAFALEQSAATADGRIARGRYERWVRVIAAFGLLDLVAVAVALVSTRATLFGGGPPAVIILALYAGMMLMLGRGFVRRLQGLVWRVPKQGAADLSMLWLQWGFLSTITSTWSKVASTAFMVKLPLVILLAGLGWHLERRGREER
jgi:hypothetical protein